GTARGAALPAGQRRGDRTEGGARGDGEDQPDPVGAAAGRTRRGRAWGTEPGMCGQQAPNPAGDCEGTVSTHVLDAVRGVPAAGIALALYAGDEPIAYGTTDGDGRVPALAAGLSPGTYRLVFATGDYFAARGEATFYPEVSVTFATGPG